MAKPKSPLLSLEAHGTIGDTLTFQKRGLAPLVRKKPIPANPKSLPQIYQRWLYEDYAYLWTQQSQANHQLYATAGSRFHLTGYQYWLKFMLTHLPNIAGWWKLDEKSGTITYDSSRNLNHGTIFGASPTTGIVDGALYFDGLNDRVTLPNTPSFHTAFNSSWTLEFTFTKHVLGIMAQLFDKPFTSHISPWYQFKVFCQANNAILAIIYNTAASYYLGPVYPTWYATADTPYHIAVSADIQAPYLKLYINGKLESQDLTSIGTYTNFNTGATLGRLHNVATYHHNGLIDNAILWTPAIDDTLILRHSKRKYP